MGNLIWLVGLAALAYVTKDRGWSEGDGPFDQRPEGTASSTLGPPEKIYAASQRQYEVTSYQRGAEQTYHVAVRVGGKDWISFITDSKTGARVLFRAHGADATKLAELRKDFAL